jgi:hypothetical protein
MANIYVRSTDGSDADNGSTWALAKATLSGAAAIDAAGDSIYVSDNHAESTAGSITLTLAGTAASPVRIICGDDAAEPPTAVATTGTVSSTGASTLTIDGSAYVYGLSFQIGDTTVSPVILQARGSGDVQMYEQCVFYIRGSGANGRVEIGCNTTAAPASKVTWRNCNVRFAGAAQGISVPQGDFTWSGGAVVSGSTALTGGFVKSPNTGTNKPSSRCLIESVDFSNVGAAFHLFDAASSVTRGIVRNCRLPAAWSGSLRTGTMRASQRFEMYNCDNADTNYRLWIDDYAGSIVHETTIVRDGGANDGTTDLAWKMTATANASYPLVRLESPEIVKWNDTVGSAQTCTVEIVHDSQGSGTSSAFTDAEVWLEIQYLGTSGVPLGSVLTDAKADVLATAADQASSAVTWTTTGLTTPLKQKVAVTFTAQEIGFIHAKVVLAKASAVCYVDPKLTVA